MSRSTNVPLPEVLSEFALSNSFLGKIIEVCLGTEDHERTMEGLVRLGIEPFRVYTFTPDTVAAQTYAGEPEDFSLKVCFATNDDLTFEISSEPPLEPVRDSPGLPGGFRTGPRECGAWVGLASHHAVRVATAAVPGTP